MYIKNTKRLRSGAETKELEDNLEVCSPYCFCKEKASAFTNEALLDLLQQNNISEIELIGVDGNSCVAVSAMDAQKNDYNTILPCRYIGAKNKARFEKKKEKLKQAGIVII